ncbi:MAG TPA: cell division protein ZipA C-terminal FtsZ-binding domain-containing protein [Usitatibacter sp.]|nr:cell division protein ZipA C-terminal FtsZ-binding domain-containing protein [Usitatibacter sp.]
MSELQLYLIGAGAVVIAGVVVYNMAQERRARRRAEKAFDGAAGDALLDGTPPARREPTLGKLPADEAPEPVLARAEPRPLAASEELAAAGGPEAEISPRIDTVAVILADDPVTREQLEPLEAALAGHAVPVHVEGIVDEQWHPVAASPRGSWRELRIGLQLASRKGPVGEEEFEAFNRAIAEFAARVNAVSQREAPAAAAARARELDGFCAEADIEVAVNVVGQFGAAFSLPRVKQLALEAGLSETASGDLVRYGEDGAPEFAIRRFDDPAAKPSPHQVAGLTFALDVPHAARALPAFDEMAALAARIAATLGGQLVDDNRRPLTEPGLASIRRSVEGVLESMEARGIPAGSALARRLFS